MYQTILEKLKNQLGSDVLTEDVQKEIATILEEIVDSRVGAKLKDELDKKESELTEQFQQKLEEYNGCKC